MDARVSPARLPVIEVDLRVSEPLEAQPLEGRALGVADPRLDLPLAIGIPDAARQRGDAVVGEHVAIEGIERRLVDVGAQHALAEVVEDDDGRRPAEPRECPFVKLRPDAAARLPREQADALAAVAEREEEEPRAPVLPRFSEKPKSPRTFKCLACRVNRKGGPMPASLSIPSPALEGAPLPHFCKGAPPPVCSASLTVVAQRAWRNGRRSGLEENLSARPETGDAELPKFGEPSHMAIPSQARSQPNREGVETRRAAPNPGFHPGHGEGIVQTANLASLLPSAVSQDGESRRR